MTDRHPKRPRDPNQLAKSIIDGAAARVNLGTVFADITKPGGFGGPGD
jgi:hypothetical protein